MSPMIPRRRVLAGMAALGLAGPAARAAGPEAPAHPLAERLAAYADGLRYADIDAATIETVKCHLIDTLGCGIAAFDEGPVRICREVALAGAGGGATVIGTGRHASPDLAAFANGGAARYYDLNDVYVESPDHSSQRHHQRLPGARGNRAGERARPHHRDRAGL